MVANNWITEKWPEHVPREIQGFEKPGFSILDDSADTYPDHVFTIFGGGTRTYSQVRDTANRVAAFLAADGIKKGDRVAIFLPNIAHYPAVYFGILKAGAICVTCNPLYTASELNYQLKDSGARTIFCMDHPQFYPTTVEAVKDTEVRTVIICNIKSSLPPVKRILGSLLGKIPKADHHEPSHHFFDTVVASASPEPPAVKIDPVTDIAAIIYTGGTTGVPKGAALTHANLVFNVNALDQWMRIPHEPGSPPERIRRGGQIASWGYFRCTTVSVVT